MSRQEKLILSAATWTTLPGSGKEAMLHGKRRASDAQGVIITRGSGPPELGGWDLSPVVGLCFVRNARS